MLINVIYSHAFQGKKKDNEKNNVISKNNNIRYREISDIINNSSKNNKTKDRPNKFNKFPFFYPFGNINSNVFINNTVIQKGNKKAKNNYILDKNNNKFN